ncbi:capsule assembly Wzi family protein [Larkinella rosea]|uniref:capsule assembly Wzi family protein n=1 Tax=Larkinella rosea TaxID=2025312 RepID=UPI00163B4FB0|nr:capsule assembly Wzi family protein [Larkinella rosea]
MKTQGVFYQALAGGLVSSSSRTPFWFRSNQFGAIPLGAPAGIVSVGASGLWGDANQTKRPYIRAGVQLVGNVNRASRFVLPEAYAAVRLGYGELYVGRRREVNGITDTLLTSGSYAWSGNAAPITQIRLGTKGFAPVKFTKGLLAVSAFYSHGWFAKTDSMQHSYLHAKALYIRIGKPAWKVRFYGGVAHYVQWGGYSDYLSKDFTFNGQIPVSWSAYKKVVFPGSVTGNNGQFATFDTINRYGNHLGSVDAAMEISLKKANLLFYIQHPWEDQSGLDGGNFPDGIYGARWQNRSTDLNNGFRMVQLTAEFMTTMNQSGPDYPRGNDDYFHNFQYIDGWTHQRRIIGTPFITRRMDADPKWYGLRGPFNSISMISNNRLQLLHIGAAGIFSSGVQVSALLSQSWNWGRPDSVQPKAAIHQFSGLATVILPTGWLGGMEWKASVALDAGDWLTPSLGGMISILKRGRF